MKNKHHFRYQNIYSATQPIPISDEIPVPIFTKLIDIEEDHFRSSTSSFNSDHDEEENIAHKAWNADQHLCIVSPNRMISYEI